MMDTQLSHDQRAAGVRSDGELHGSQGRPGPQPTTVLRATPRGAEVRALWAIALAGALVGVTAIAAQSAGVHPVSGRRYALPMSVEGASWLNRPDREQEEQPDLALRLLKIEKGATVADVGAGSGYMTLKLAKIVGPTGRVYANDIQPGMLTLLQQNVARAKINNVTPVLGTLDDPKLPANALDLVIMVDVYHELSEPQKVLARIRESLKPAGRLVLFEYRAEDPAVPIQPLHKMTVAQARLEVEHEGFTLSKTQEDLPRQHLLTFMKREPARSN